MRTVNNTRMSNFTVSFDSLTEITEFVRSDYVEYSANELPASRMLRRDDYGFFNGVTNDNLEELITNPPTYIRELFDRHREELVNLLDIPQVPTRRRRNKLEEGDELDPVSWIRRDIDGWSDMTQESKPKHVVRIASFIGAYASESVADVIWRGITASVIADELSKLNISVEITAVAASTGVCENDDGPDRCMITTLIKPADAPLDLGAVMLATAEIGFFRRVYLTARARALPVEISTGFGATDGRLNSEETKDYDYFIGRDVRTLDQAKLTVARIIGAEAVRG